jgi:hypothetical protein
VKTRAYSVVLVAPSDDPNAALDWKSAREVESTTHRDAALLAFRLAPLGHPGRAAFHSLGRCVAWVWDESHPKHPNGAPICVHKLELASPKPETIGGAA